MDAEQSKITIIDDRIVCDQSGRVAKFSLRNVPGVQIFENCIPVAMKNPNSDPNFEICEIEIITSETKELERFRGKIFFISDRNQCIFDTKGDIQSFGLQIYGDNENWEQLFFAPTMMRGDRGIFVRFEPEWPNPVIADIKRK